MKFRIFRKRSRRREICTALALALVALVTSAAEVNQNIYSQIGDGTPTFVSTTIVGTTTNCVTPKAATINDSIFTHWTISTEQTFAPRDAWGRAKDAADYVPYQDTTLTAHYLSSSIDTDNDDVADGYEYYWYNSLEHDGNYDGDGDGYTFSQELRYGTNPLFPDAPKITLAWADSAVLLYNPNGCHKLTVKSSPEGELFDTEVTYYPVGSSVNTTQICADVYDSATTNKYLYSVNKTSFAYWTKNGVRQTDAWGRALDYLEFTMPNEDVTLIAYSEWDKTTRQKLYWYGDSSVDLTSDTDGDGYTLEEELAAGTNPYFADIANTVYHGVVHTLGESVTYNPLGAHLCTIRSEPEGKLFDTTTEMIEKGKTVTSPTCNRNSTWFSYWTANGTRVADAWGRAVDQVKMTMPDEDLELIAVAIENESDRMKAYWYANPPLDMSVDTDGDGYSLAQELQQGTNPLFPDYTYTGYTGVVSDNSDTHEMNLQIYENLTSVLMNGNYTTLDTFGPHTTPCVCDWNNDGKHDLLVGWAGGVVLYLNKGSNTTPNLLDATASLSDELKAWFANAEQPALAAGTGVLYLSDQGGTIQAYTIEDNTFASTGLTGRPGVLDRSDWAKAQASSARGLIHRWSFNGAQSDNVEIENTALESDSVGGQFAELKGTVTADGKQVTLAGGSKGTSWISLGTNILPNDGSAATLEIWATPRSIQSYSRVFSIGSSTSDNVHGSWSCGTQPTSSSPAEIGVNGQCKYTMTFDLDTEYHYAVVFEPQEDGTWNVTFYNQKAATGATVTKTVITTSSSWSLKTLGQNVCALGRSQYSDPDANASYNEVRVWNRALTEEELTANALAGADDIFAQESESEEVESDEQLVALGEDGSLTLLDGTTFSVDEPMTSGTSLSFGNADSDGLTDILAGDAIGRIWYYKRTSETGFTLQYKVWGGSYEGFATDLAVTATDWDDDGDLDAFVGAADGRLLLMRDPKGGRPANPSLSAGADSVSIKWDPDTQSRIRGYYVYRSAHGADSWTKLGVTEIPRYLDTPEEGGNFDYALTSVTRLYKTGNSRPITVESAKSETLSASVGTVAFTWRPAAGFEGDDVTIDLSVENARHLSPENFQLQIKYDPAVLVPTGVTKSGLTENLLFNETRGTGSWLVVGAGGSINPGSGTFLSFTFAVVDGTKLADTSVTIADFQLKSTGHSNVIPAMTKDVGDVEIGGESENPNDPAVVVPKSRGDLDGNGRLGWNDVELFLHWKDHPQSEIPEAVRTAGDFNGDGLLDNRDYPLLKRHFRDCEARGGNMTGWNDHHGYKGVEQ